MVLTWLAAFWIPTRRRRLFLQVTVNWFQMQQPQMLSLPAHYQALSDSAKSYEPGECYAEFVRNLPKNLPKERLHSDSVSSDNTRYKLSDSGHSRSIRAACHVLVQGF